MSLSVGYAGTQSAPRLFSRHRHFFRFFTVVVVIQGVHVIEHIIQFLQVMVFDVPGERAFGLLGYIINFNKTAEWLHLGFNSLYLASLFWLVLAAHELMLDGVIPRWAFRTFLFGGVGVESWHFTEHIVIIYHVVRNHGCPCPGIGDQALGIMDIQLHLGYNAIAYSATLVPYMFVLRARRNHLMA